MVLGGKLKFAEFTSGRFADVMSNLFLGYAVLWHHKKFPLEGNGAVLEYTMRTILHETEAAFFDIFDNFPVSSIGTSMRIVTFPRGRCYPKPNDKLTVGVAEAISTDTAFWRSLRSNLYMSPDSSRDRVALIIETLPKAIQADAALTAIRKEKRSATAAEQNLIDEVERARETIIQVDSFERLGQEQHMGAGWTHGMRPAFTAGTVAAPAQTKVNA
jgi:hypothetical protein